MEVARDIAIGAVAISREISCLLLWLGFAVTWGKLLLVGMGQLLLSLQTLFTDQKLTHVSSGGRRHFFEAWRGSASILSTLRFPHDSLHKDKMT